MPDGYQSEYTSQLLGQFEETPFDVYFENSRGIITQLALAPPERVAMNANAGLQVPRVLNVLPSTFGDRPYFRTSASLDELEIIEPCFAGTIITGVLLYYKDGYRASLGHIRLDKITNTSITTVPGEQIVFTSAPFGDFPGLYMRSIEVQRSRVSESGPIVSVRLCGTLEWWYSGTSCELRWYP